MHDGQRKPFDGVLLQFTSDRRLIANEDDLERTPGLTECFHGASDLTVRRKVAPHCVESNFQSTG
jgi:hypothetical protein